MDILSLQNDMFLWLFELLWYWTQKYWTAEKVLIRIQKCILHVDEYQQIDTSLLEEFKI